MVTENNINFTIQSLGENSLESYLSLENRLLDFLNFIITKGVVLQSFEGIFNEGGHFVPITVLFRSILREKMNKITIKSPFLFDYGEVSDKINAVLDKWFRLYEEVPEILHLYFGVMYNIESYLSNNFLMLFTALEVYYRVFSENNENELPAKRQIEEIYENFKDVLPILSTKIENKTQFVNKIVSYRNNLVHGKVKYDKIDLFWQYKNLQLLLQLCILTGLGFNLQEIRRIYLLDKIPNTR